MKIQRQKYDLDLARIGDEELVIMANECGYEPAKAELLRRHYERARGLVRWLSRRARLRAGDVEDAQQNAVLSIAEAVRRYDTAQLVRPGGCSFRTFLHKIVTSRYYDFRKHLARRAKKQRLLEEAALETWRTSPEDDREWSEASARLQEALIKLPSTDRSFLEDLLSGVKLRRLAFDLNLSYDAVKRRRRELIALLALELRKAGAL